VLASRCLRPGRCEAATSGTLHLSKFSEGRVRLASTNCISRTEASKRAALMLRGASLGLFAG